MSKGNKEIRFRASPEIHKIVEDTQEEIQAIDKSAGAKLLLTLGNDKILDAVNYIDSITHPLTEAQFENFFLALKIRIKQLRNDRKRIKNQ